MSKEFKELLRSLSELDADVRNLASRVLPESDLLDDNMTILKIVEKLVNMIEDRALDPIDDIQDYGNYDE